MRSIFLIGLLLLGYSSVNAQAIIDGVHINVDAGVFMRFANDVTLRGATFITTNGPIAFEGDLKNETSPSVFDLASSDFIAFEGATPQEIEGDMHIPKMEIENSDGLDLAGSTRISLFTQLTFIDGIMRSGTDGLVNFQIGSMYTGESDISHISGTAAKTGDESFVFPIGSGLKLRPISMSAPNEVSDQISAEYIAGTPTSFGAPLSGEIRKICDQEYWNIDRLVGLSSIQLGLPKTDNECSVLEQDVLTVAHFDGTQWNRANANDLTMGAVEFLETIDGQGFLPAPYTFGESAYISIDGTEALTSTYSATGSGIGTTAFSAGPGSAIAKVTPDLPNAGESGTFQLLIDENTTSGIGALNLTVGFNDQLEVTDVLVLTDGQSLPLYEDYYQVEDGYKLKFFASKPEPAKSFFVTNLVGGKVYNPALGAFQITVPNDLEIINPQLSISQVLPASQVILSNDNSLTWTESAPQAGTYSFTLVAQVQGEIKSFEGQFLVE